LSENITPELRPAPDGGQLERLATLENAPETVMDAHHPVRDATAIALLKPAGDLIGRYAARQRAHAAEMAGEAVVSRETMPAILAMAETQVALALLGDAKAYAAIADRVEGKAGLRKADVDAETEAQRQRVRLTIEELVRDMGERRARTIDGEVVSRETTGRET
jgi:hypothetical protein